MTGVTYDSGALIAAERSERRMWARHRALLLRRVVPTVAAPVIAQCWRGIPRQAQLARLLAGCETETLDDTRARATGTLAGRARVADIVDVSVVEPPCGAATSYQLRRRRSHGHRRSRRPPRRHRPSITPGPEAVTLHYQLRIAELLASRNARNPARLL